MSRDDEIEQHETGSFEHTEAFFKFIPQFSVSVSGSRLRYAIYVMDYRVVANDKSLLILHFSNNRYFKCNSKSLSKR